MRDEPTLEDATPEERLTLELTQESLWCVRELLSFDAVTLTTPAGSAGKSGHHYRAALDHAKRAQALNQKLNADVSPAVSDAAPEGEDEGREDTREGDPARAPGDPGAQS